MKYFIQKQANIKPHDIFLFISTHWQHLRTIQQHKLVHSVHYADVDI